jgi:hypothetical protein
MLQARRSMSSSSLPSQCTRFPQYRRCYYTGDRAAFGKRKQNGTAAICSHEQTKPHGGCKDAGLQVNILRLLCGNERRGKTMRAMTDDTLL